MSIYNSVKPEDILADDQNTAILNGVSVRKGTVAAFLANADILENPNPTQEQKHEALMMIKELAPAVIAGGLHKHVVFKNPQIEQILVDAGKSSNQ